MKPAARADVVSSFTLIKGAMLDETWTAFCNWDLDATLDDNLARLKIQNPFGATVNWRRDIHKVLHRRIDIVRDRPLILLAQAGCDRALWNPLHLWHITRDEFLLREFLTGWLFDRFTEGAWRVSTSDVTNWLIEVEKTRGFAWKETTRKRVAAGLLKMGSDYGLLTGTVSRRFAPYHLPDASLLYVLHALYEDDTSARHVIEASDWRIFRLRPEDVEAELLRLHQYRRLHFDVAGSLAQLRLPAPTLAAFARTMAEEMSA